MVLRQPAQSLVMLFLMFCRCGLACQSGWIALYFPPLFLKKVKVCVGLFFPVRLGLSLALFTINLHMANFTIVLSQL